MGSYHTKELALHMIKALLPNPTVETNLADRGIVTYTYQEEASRYVAHLLFAHTTKRGNGIEIIEDIIPLYGINLTAAVPTAPKRVYKVEYENGALKETDLAYAYENGKAVISVDKVDLHAIVVIDV